MKSFTIASNHATNAVAASTAVEITTSLEIAVDGMLVPSSSLTIPAVLLLQLDPGATPGTYDFEVEQSATSGGTYTDIQALDETTAVSGVSAYNVEIDPTKPFIRVNITDATANAGTLTAILLVG